MTETDENGNTDGTIQADELAIILRDSLGDCITVDDVVSASWFGWYGVGRAWPLRLFKILDLNLSKYVACAASSSCLVMKRMIKKCTLATMLACF